MPALDLKPLTSGQIMGTGWSLFRRHFNSMARWAVLTYSLPMAVLVVGLQFVLPPEEYPNWFFLIRRALALFFFLVFLVPGITFMASRAWMGDDVTMLDAGRFVHKNSKSSLESGLAIYLVLVLILAITIGPPMAIASDSRDILGAVGIGFLTGCFGLCALIAVCMFAGLAPICGVMDDMDSRAAFSRSSRLLKGFRWRPVGVLIVMVLLAGAPGVPGLLSTPGVLAEALLEKAHLGWLGIGVAEFWQGLLLPVLVTPLVAISFEQRCRKESFDLAVLAQQFGVEEKQMENIMRDPNQGYYPPGYTPPRRQVRRPVRRRMRNF